MQDQDSQARLSSLRREVSSLAASLQRESQRRAAVAAHAKEQEELASAANGRVRQLQYANNKLSQELEQLRDSKTGSTRLLELEQTVANRTTAAGSQIQHVKLLLAQLLQPGAGSTPLPARQQLRQIAEAVAEAERLLCSGAAGPPVKPAIALDTDAEKVQLQEEVQRLQAELLAARQQQQLAKPTPTPQPAAPGPSVEAAVEELQAVLPQYRAAAAHLQGHAALLQKQLAAAAAERDELKEQAAAWREAATRQEAAHAAATAKLHTLEARSLAASAESQERGDRLSGELAEARQRCASLQAALQAAQEEGADAAKQLAARAALAQAQQETIARLEGTISEQQADIVAALDLVCARSPAAIPTTSATRHNASPAHDDFGGGHAAPPAPAAAESLDFRLDEAAAAAADLEGCCCSQQDWTISAVGRGGEDDWLREPLGLHAPLPAKAAPSVARPVDKPARVLPHAALRDVASDIAALQQALREALAETD